MKTFLTNFTSFVFGLGFIMSFGGVADNMPLFIIGIGLIYWLTPLLIDSLWIRFPTLFSADVVNPSHMRLASKLEENVHILSAVRETFPMSSSEYKAIGFAARALAFLKARVRQNELSDFLAELNDGLSEKERQELAELRKKD